jgi:hypothetical protein
MSLQLKINSVDVSLQVSWESLAKVEGLTKEPDTLAFSINKTPTKTIPDLGAIVELYEDSVKIFAGAIVGRKDVIVGGILEGYEFDCKDYTDQLDSMLVVRRYENQTARDILLDIIAQFATGFTTTNVAASTPDVASIKFNYEPVSKAIQKLADLIGWDWYVDYDKDIHFFAEESLSAPFNLDDTSGNFEWGSLELSGSILELRNSIFIRGGEYLSTIAEADAADKGIADGTQRVILMGYRYQNIQIKVGGVAKTVGIDPIDDPTAFDCLYNFNEKALKFRDDNKPAASASYTIFGNAYIPLIVHIQDQGSIGSYGERQHVEFQKDITSIDEAITFGRSQLRQWNAGAQEAKFKTKVTGLKTGMSIRVTSVIRGIDKTFKINKIDGKARGNDHMIYEISLLASGQVTFTDMMEGLLSADRKNVEIADNEILQRLMEFNESISISDTASASKRSGPYKWGADANALVWDLSTWS